MIAAVACYQDYRYDKICNWLMGIGLAAGISYQLIAEGGYGAAVCLGGWVVVFFLTFPLFALGMIGAGDIKLFMVCAGFLGWRDGIVFLFFSFLIGAFFSILKMIHHKNVMNCIRCLAVYVREIFMTSEWLLYEKGTKEKSIHLSGPVLLALLVQLGGIV